ncbi:uncharacterized protein LOC132054224 [Lycium ferocissimum]|uniref:uncharacterized protein LOC132054224 n=1 Tax=Lycium ferocissimum TaxID=112874 RepID=UPI0028155273|nr:uncharacterized protein LOC132054224 [Lycium ferocissimum]
MIWEFQDGSAITFTDEDAAGITLPHNDALVVTLSIDRVQVKRVMVDPGSSANIIRWKVVEEMEIQEKIILAARTLAGFNMSSETTKGEIDLHVKVGGVVKQTKFYVIDGDMRYHGIFGRTWLHEMKAVPSTLHILIKFPTPDEIRQIS